MTFSEGKAMNISALSLLAIMPGHLPLGLDLEERVKTFAEKHGCLPVLVFVPRELRPEEVLSWAVYLGLGEGLPELPGTPGPAPKSVRAGPVEVAKNASGPGDDVHHKGRAERARNRGRPGIISKALAQEIVTLAAQGMGVETIVKTLQARGIWVSERTVARRLTAQRG